MYIASIVAGLLWKLSQDIQSFKTPLINLATFWTNPSDFTKMRVACGLLPLKRETHLYCIFCVYSMQNIHSVHMEADKLQKQCVRKT